PPNPRDMRTQDPSSMMPRLFRDLETIQLADALEESHAFVRVRENAREKGFRTILCTPLVREGEAIGCIFVRRRDVDPFTDRQVALLKTFADQAVIAIENVRLFTELNERNAQLRGALDRQTATSEVLSIISGSTAETAPVFDAIVN